jgi:FkbM family methyltransferase
MNLFIRSIKHLAIGIRKFFLIIQSEDPSKMVGRIFDLQKKQLVVLDGFSIFVMPNDYVGASIIATQSYEPNVTRVIKNLLKAGDVFLDLGGNVGYFSMLASRLVKNNGKVLTFEPNPQNLQLIYSSQLQNEASNIMVYPYAASDTSTILRFTTVGSNGGIVTEHSDDQNYYLLVQSVVLDEILQNEPRIDLVKIDIEAHEPSALRGMVNLIKTHKPKIITEFHPWAMKLNNLELPEKYLEQLYDLGYRLSIILPSGDLHIVSSAKEIMNYWESLGKETIHLDLLAEPNCDL